jgi:hypothetical protein
MRELVAYPDAEKAVITYLVPILQAYGGGVGIDVRGSGGRFVRVRRIGGTEASPAHDRASLDVLVWHDTDLLRMRLAQHLWAALRAADGDEAAGAVLSYSGTVLGPRQMPDPADANKSVCLFTVELLLRNA